MQNARQIAFKILYRLENTRQTLDHWLDRAAPDINLLSQPDKALTHALVYGVLRWQLRLDWIIDQLKNKPGQKIDPPVRLILRMGLFQLIFLDRIPDRAAVHTSVELAKKAGCFKSAGFVNGVLRNAIRKQNDLVFPAMEKDTVQALAIDQSLPQWLVSRWLDRFGLDQAHALCRSVNAIPQITIRTNTLKTDRRSLLDDIENFATAACPTDYSPEGIRFSSCLKPIQTWPAFKNGHFQVQDEAAQIIGHFLAPKPGNYVWDACAGLGTKTAHMAQLMKNEGTILATDIIPKKLSRHKAEMKRLGVKIIEACCLDLSQPEIKIDLPAFDTILVDAPCSGAGVLQKNPDGKWRINPSILKQNAKRQYQLLKQASTHLKKNGRIVYTVCSMEPEETTQVTEDFLQRNPDFAIHISKLPAVAHSQRILNISGNLNTLPHWHGIDGFFAVAFKKSV
ncbi:MAG: 16S rRNA (cytosine(967)-C(5))-methyltransferase RsmB [Desulfobacteraceae bacterium]|nr:16S rRNA (cytosine(967)-C(5))-methyltransferase RsmB [Desulfobacteraceae bacterium]